MGSLIARGVGSIGSSIFSSRVISSGTSHSVTDETFVVSDVFGALSRRQIDSVYVHCHRIFGGLFGSRVSGGISLSASEFLHSQGSVEELACFVQP